MHTNIINTVENFIREKKNSLLDNNLLSVWICDTMGLPAVYFIAHDLDGESEKIKFWDTLFEQFENYEGLGFQIDCCLTNVEDWERRRKWGFSEIKL